MKKILTAIIVFNISFISLYANGIPLSTQSDTNTYSWIKGRQIISVNLSPGYAGLFPPMINTLFDNLDTFSGLIGFDFGENQKFVDAIKIKGSFWYVPTISYTLLLHPRIGIEVGVGVQSMSFNLNIPKDKASELIDSTVTVGDFGNIGGLISSDTGLKASLIFVPVTFGITFYGGKNRQVLNTFRFGLETLISDVETENGVTGLKTKRHTIDTGMYISYELGWSIELFPTREWAVKPYIDISLFEIGYYVRSGLPGVYEDMREGINFFGGGLIDLTASIPAWNSFPSWVNYVSAIRFSIFPRIGFSLRF
ncbi:hypothetical protein [Brachyspira hampsonii]|uniref:Uncharacterized protein n=1 Tax=Brachyspira hampsonii TaxID=1287055 RepID=A0AAC9XKM1_9SPIR|nr:hypothetical protein [Brachyspira hampsonii]ASJ20969.1 hypothetical protein BHAMNSH16_04645 [Brachyspira hampsonii]ELV06762.1 hypothetical protein H263_02195 [Brachyspira hampsonii 30599]MBW5379995.1 hypothetical protein [Brachyspira hampsonii]MBW5410577.1 hypothetical protein [Brachyspira hampsonii]OEJ13301.1 hypothetical protein A9496_02525 [Brachyspira hampsonii]